ncbi:MAG: GNAT family N-acetyltransferase [Bacteroidetes bacterium]|nr:GNAT family N-acetyltransferase [Bacteroidota bacterium]
MIRYIKNNDIDTDKWDECIQHSFNGNVYAYAWYLDIVHENWDALVQDDYERVMPLPVSRKFRISYIYQPFFVQQLGVFSKSILTPEIVQDFICNIPKKFKLVDINLNSYNTPDRNLFHISPNKNHVLDLINKYATLSEKYATNTKRNLKKSLKYNLSLVKGIKPETLIQLFRNNKGKEIKNWGETEYQRLHRLMYMAIYKGRGVVYGVFNEHNQLCAGAFFLKSNNRLIFLFSATNQQAKETAAMTFLIDSVIREFAPGKLVLDFEGSNDTNLSRFYKGFGAKEVTYPRLRINNLNVFFKPLYKLMLRIKNYKTIF